MVNVLPQQYKQSVARTYSERLVMTSVVAVLLTAVVAGIALLPSFSSMYAADRDSTPSSTDTQGSTQKADASAVAEAAFLAHAMERSMATSSRATDVITAIIKDKPKGISIQTITYSKDVSGPGTMVITGKTAGRTDITSFQAALKADTHFLSVSIPIDVLVGGDNGTFTIRIVPSS